MWVPSKMCILEQVQFEQKLTFGACTIDAQSFSNSFEGVHGVVRKSGKGSSIFIEFLC